MKIKVITPFADAVTHKMYRVGEVIDLPDPRAESAIKHGRAIATKAVTVETADVKVVKKSRKKEVKEEVIEDVT